MRAVCMSSQLLLVMAGVKCSAGYGRNNLLLLFLILPLYFQHFQKKKKRKEENSTKKKKSRNQKAPTRFMFTIPPYLLQKQFGMPIYVLL